LAGVAAKGAADLGQAVSPGGKTDVSGAKSEVAAITGPVSIIPTVFGGNAKLGNQAQGVVDNIKTISTSSDRVKQLGAAIGIASTVRGWVSSAASYFVVPPPPPGPPTPH
jgi:hypothetical protein